MKTDKPTLFIMAGLPGTGKTTLSQLLSKHLGITHLRIDTIEQALRDLCDIQVSGEGYRLSYRIASDNLRLGHSVIADSCNPIKLSRDEWEAVALHSNATPLNIEIICSDKDEHKTRVETRKPTIPGHQLPTWEKVLNREYDQWDRHRLQIDTAGKTTAESLKELLAQIENLN